MRGKRKEAPKDVINWRFLDSQFLRDAVGDVHSFSSYGREKIVNLVKGAEVYTEGNKLVLSSKNLSLEFVALDDSRVVSPRQDGLQDVSTQYSCTGFSNESYRGEVESLNVAKRPHRLYFDFSSHVIRPLPAKSNI